MSQPDAPGVWSNAMWPDDPQTGDVYLHVPRETRRPGYITDTQWHIQLRHDKKEGMTEYEGKRFRQAFARRLVACIRFCEDTSTQELEQRVAERSGQPYQGEYLASLNKIE